MSLSPMWILIAAVLIALAGWYFVDPAGTPAIELAPCRCSDRDLSCSDFATQADAQSCYEYCTSRGYGVAMQLDPDRDGRACEALP